MTGACRWCARSGAKAAALPEAGGVFVAVVGPSGAGKDSLIAAARAALAGDPRFLFVRRVVTRPAEAELEDHGSLSEAGFAEAAARGSFAAVWRAHGLSYGIPARARDHVRAGGVAVANCSRAALGEIANAFPALEIVLVTAEPAVLAARLAGRGRESAADIEERLRRQVEDFPGRERAVLIDNGGRLEDAAARFIAVLRGFAG